MARSFLGIFSMRIPEAKSSSMERIETELVDA